MGKKRLKPVGRGNRISVKKGNVLAQGRKKTPLLGKDNAFLIFTNDTGVIFLGYLDGIVSGEIVNHNDFKLGLR